MNKLVKLLASATLLGGISAPAMASDTASTTTNGTSRIIQSITITENSALAFGTIVRPTSGTNDISIDATTGARSKSGAGDAALAASTSGRASYTVGGEGGQTFSISTPSTFSMSSGANSLVVTLSTSAATGTLSGSLGSSGTATFGVGGTITVPSTQSSGAYTGSFATTVTYN
jgi:hypothetical protein